MLASSLVLAMWSATFFMDKVHKVLDFYLSLCYSLRVVRRERKIMKVGNLVQWVLNQPGFPKRQGVITHTFRFKDGIHQGKVTSHRVHWVSKHTGKLVCNTFRPRDLEVLA